MGESNEPERQKFVEDFEKRFVRDKIRFAVGRPGEGHSGTWAMWAHNDDYYIGARSILGSTKISLHASGICRVALTERHMKMIVDRGLDVPNDRAFVKWTRYADCGVRIPRNNGCANTQLCPSLLHKIFRREKPARRRGALNFAE